MSSLQPAQYYAIHQIQFTQRQVGLMKPKVNKMFLSAVDLNSVLEHLFWLEEVFWQGREINIYGMLHF